MTVADTVIYFGRLKGMSAADAARSAGALIERLGLSAWAKTTLDKLSKGMSQKVQLATALVNAPRLLILDEPFSGLDPVNQGVLEEIVLEMAKDGATVIFSTHVMQHAERLSDRLLLLARGRKVFEGTQAEARAKLPPRLLLTAQADRRNCPAWRAPSQRARRKKAGRNGTSPWCRAVNPPICCSIAPPTALPCGVSICTNPACTTFSCTWWEEKPDEPHPAGGTPRFSADRPHPCLQDHPAARARDAGRGLGGKHVPAPAPDPPPMSWSMPAAVWRR